MNTPQFLVVGRGFAALGAAERVDLCHPRTEERCFYNQARESGKVPALRPALESNISGHVRLGVAPVARTPFPDRMGRTENVNRTDEEIGSAVVPHSKTGTLC